MNIKTVIATIIILMSVCVNAVCSNNRIEIDLSGQGWSLWQDQKANWQNDPFFLPPVNVSSLPVNIPGGGWESLNQPTIKEVSVPSTAEMYLQKKYGIENDIKGVTWWYRNISIPVSSKGRKMLLRFESTRYRSEVFIDGQLAGYDFIGNTPYNVDITRFVKPGQSCRLAVRITDPDGNFDWKDGNNKWGSRVITGSLGFGGITGRVKLLACDETYIEDIYMQNTPQFRKANAIVTVRNESGKTIKRDVEVKVYEANNPTNVVFTTTLHNNRLGSGENVLTIPVDAPDAKLWDIDSPNLYHCEVTLKDGKQIQDQDKKRFGFRWFEPTGFGKDAILRLNGNRIVLRTAISWGFWPITGMVPTKELAERQIRLAKSMGLNMLNFHRCIGQPMMLELADELGLLFYEEPGNYQQSTLFPLTRKTSRERLLRMVRRDRSHPSMVMYCMQNEVREVADSIFNVYRNDMADAHRIDPSRLIVRTSGWANGYDIDDQAKLHMRPFDDKQYMNGWYDFHRAVGPHTWMQSFYKSPTDYYGFTSNKGEIVYWGEEGALSAPPRIALIKKELDASTYKGWDGQLYLEQYDAFDRYFKSKGLARYFKDIDQLTTTMGAISFDHQGRKIELTRINNVADGYAVNGWESEIFENHSGIVDCFRNPKADPAILAYYNQPLYIAVKSRKQVFDLPDRLVTDLYMVNENKLKGEFDLHFKVINPQGQNAFETQKKVNVKGGDCFGELLSEGVEKELTNIPGYYKLEAWLTDGQGTVKAKGVDSILAIDWRSDVLKGSGAVWESGQTLIKYLKEKKNANVEPYSVGMNHKDWIVVSRSPKGGDMSLVPGEQFLDKDGKAGGVTTTYFMGANFEKEVAKEFEPQVCLMVNEGATPHPAVPATFNYSIRWEGFIKPMYSGLHNFRLEFGYGGQATVEIDGHLSGVVDKMTQTLNCDLEAGKMVKVKVELRHTRYTGAARLFWSTPEPASDAQLLMNRVINEGTTLVILENAPAWMDIIQKNTNVKYTDKFTVGTNWLGGTHFAVTHPLLSGLPMNQGLGWPYEAVVRNGNERIGLQLDGEELVVGNYHCYPQKLGTAVGVIPCGKGKIIFSTLDIFNNLNRSESTSAVARKLLNNFINYR